MKRGNAWRVLLVGALVLGACSDDDNKADSRVKFDALVTADSGTDGAAPADVQPDQATSIPFLGKVIDGTLPPPWTGVSGAKACVLPGKTVCATAAANGTFALMIPTAGEVALSVEAASFGLLVYSVYPQDTVPQETYLIPLSPTSKTTGYFTLAGVTLDSTKGIISVGTYDSGKHPANAVAGVSVTISPAPGSAVIYMNASRMPDKTLTATSALGMASAANVAPGDYQVSFSHATKSCALSGGIGWPGTTAGSAKVQVMANHSAWLPIVCK